ncbi:hypothetical protein HC256_005548 [Beauveria bassiana]|nr:hypothetical protein HC256_005548 [Beauveria bassiana]
MISILLRRFCHNRSFNASRMATFAETAKMISFAIKQQDNTPEITVLLSGRRSRSSDETMSARVWQSLAARSTYIFSIKLVFVERLVQQFLSGDSDVSKRSARACCIHHIILTSPLYLPY